MTKTYLKPLVLAASVALALTACGKQESANTPAAPAGSASTAAVASTAAAPAPSVFDVSELGASGEACKDFNQFVNAKWIAANPIPADQTVWGSFNLLREKSLSD
jgi:putative endopeptidase